MVYDEEVRRTDGYLNWVNFTTEFDKLRTALLASKTVEHECVIRVDELKSELVDSGKRLLLAAMVKSEDEKTIALLRHEMERCMKMARLCKRKEVRAQELLAKVNNEVRQLREKVKMLEESQQTGAASTNVEYSTRKSDKVDRDQTSQQSLVSSVQQQVNGGGIHIHDGEGEDEFEDPATVKLTPFELWKMEQNIWTPTSPPAQIVPAQDRNFHATISEKQRPRTAIRTERAYSMTRRGLPTVKQGVGMGVNDPEGMQLLRSIVTR